MPSVRAAASAFAAVPATRVRHDLGLVLVSTAGAEFNADPTTASDGRTYFMLRRYRKSGFLHWLTTYLGQP
jgi:hypothetical protein